MSKCVNKRRLGKFGAIPHEEQCLRKQLVNLSFCHRKTCSSFLNYVSSTSLDIALKLPSSERRKIILLMDSVQISPCGFFCEHGES